MLSRLFITFLPRSKHLLISWLQSPSAVILEPRKINSDTVSTVSASICHEVMGPDAMILVAMEYYSVIKNNTFESVLMRWMNLEPVTELSQRNKCRTLTYIYGI